jgi:hypothetical protein
VSFVILKFNSYPMPHVVQYMQVVAEGVSQGGGLPGLYRPRFCWYLCHSVPPAYLSGRLRPGVPRC